MKSKKLFSMFNKSQKASSLGIIGSTKEFELQLERLKHKNNNK